MAHGTWFGVWEPLSYLFGMVVYHARGVVDSQTDLILAFTGLGPSKPNLVFSKLTSNVWNNLSHVQSLPSSIVSSVKCTQMDKDELETAHPTFLKDEITFIIPYNTSYIPNNQ